MPDELPPHPYIPLPPSEKLNTRYILGEIRDHIRDFNKLFPFVDLHILFDQVTAVRRKDVSPETQIRQFLQAFKNTETFKDAFSLLDEGTQKKIHSFTKGKSAEEVTRKGGFNLPPSPAAKHHFRLLDLFHSLFETHAKENHEPVKKIDAKDVTDAPKIFEDKNNSKIMK
ncbi:MAG: hypothetical protein Q9214_004263, partial [Letrouitia sp. 1 TL-2023]